MYCLHKRLTIAVILFVTFGCSKQEQPLNQPDYQYHAHIYRPLPTVKYLGDSLHIDVEFESHAGLPVHHISVRIMGEADGEIIYDEPHLKEVNGSDLSFRFQDTILLDPSNGIRKDSKYILEASVWGESDSAGLETEQVQLSIQ